MNLFRDKIVENKKIVIVSETIPPDYSGAGISALMIADFFNDKNRLFAILTSTKYDHRYKYNINESKIYRTGLSSKFIKSKKNVLIKFILYFFLLIYYFIFSAYFFLNNRRNFDIIFFVSTSYFTFILVFFCNIFKKKYIIETTTLGYDDPLGNSTKKFVFLKNKFKRYIYFNAEKITNISPALENSCLKFGINQNKLFLIPRTVNENNFYPVNEKEKLEIREKLNLNNTAFPIIFFAGVLHKNKGVDIVLNTYNLLKKTYPQILLILAGDSRKYEPLKKQYKIEWKDKHVINLGIIGNVHEYMKASDLFFFPSRKEGLGRVFVEAMSIGLPVICKKLPGVTDYIFSEDKPCAIIVDSDEPICFKDKIIDLLNNDILIKQFRENAIDRYKIKFSNNFVLNKYLELLDSISKNANC